MLNKVQLVHFVVVAAHVRVVVVVQAYSGRRGCSARDGRLLHLCGAPFGPHVKRAQVQRVERDVDWALRVLGAHRDARRFRLFDVRYGDVHRRVKSLEFCGKVLVLWHGEVNALIDGKLDIGDDGAGTKKKKKKSKPSKALFTSGSVLPYPFPVSIESFVVLFSFLLLCNDIFAYTALRWLIRGSLLETNSTYPLMVSKCILLVALKFPEISAPDVRTMIDAAATD